MKAIPLLWLTALLSWPGTVPAQTGDLTLRQLNQRVFGATDGAPTDISALAQTADGTLWVGGRAGLTRFDGLRFVPYPGSGDQPLQQTNVSALLATADGSLGLGLYIAREIAKGHGGEITARSAGSETTFRTRLPRFPIT